MTEIPFVVEKLTPTLPHQHTPRHPSPDPGTEYVTATQLPAPAASTPDTPAHRYVI
ncbi:hypothetical protein ACFXPY_36960 [Streptomyces sp. NPDC059153]|uniref:hypothetical protein n=1 Tax=unclassified Streptomyces TaxID=2593676 RepID=UPI00369355E0